MKLNWGTGIVIAFVIFAALLTVAMVLGSQERVDLVTPDYYEQELKFQDQINSRENAKTIGDITVKATASDVKITFPEAIKADEVTGRVVFYKPDNANFDFQELISISTSNTMVINRENRISGFWTIKVEAEQNGTAYYWEEKINM